MTIEELGSIGELLAAVATLVTLIYLAVQVRQNTRALQSSTFQNITGEMAKNVEPISTNEDVAAIMVKGISDPANLTPEERLRLASIFVATFRRLESVFVQNQLGSISDEMKEGFEFSIVNLLNTPFGREWWQSAKVTFFQPYVEHLEQRASAAGLTTSHPSMLYGEKDTA